MTAHQFLLILLARKRLILTTVLVAVLATLGISLIQTPTYKATASVLLNYKGIDTLTGVTLPGQLLPGYMATQVDIIGSKNVALRVVDVLKLGASADVQKQFRSAAEGRGTVQDWLAALLLKKLDIVPARESSVVEISFKGSDPAFAAAVANAFAEQYQKLTVLLKTEPMKNAAQYFNDQTRQLRDNVEAAQARLSKYQQDKGILSLDNTRVDVELARLNDLAQQLVLAQSQAMEGNSRQRVASGAAGASPDVANNALVQNLRASIAVAEGRFAELSQKVGRNNPQYQSSKAELDHLHAVLNATVGNVGSSVGHNATVLRQHEAQLHAAVAAQQTRILALNRARDELGVLQKDVDSAQRALDAAALRFSQTRIEAQAEQSDVAILNPATAPIEAASPRLLLNGIVALLLGTVVGVAIAVLTELRRRPLRSVADLHALAGVPVLGVVDWQAPARKRSALQWLAPRRLRLN